MTPQTSIFGEVFCLFDLAHLPLENSLVAWLQLTILECNEISLLKQKTHMEFSGSRGANQRIPYHELSVAGLDSLALCQTHLDGVDQTMISTVFAKTTLLGNDRTRAV